MPKAANNSTSSDGCSTSGKPMGNDELIVMMTKIVTDANESLKADIDTEMKT